jgi:hypothetical protein
MALSLFFSLAALLLLLFCFARPLSDNEMAEKFHHPFGDSES